ncbi:MAG: GAF domain-containing protein, partial [Candidatus Dojkabacteria bacterium]
TKETILKIAKTLDLNAFQTGSLLNIDYVAEVQDLLEISTDINTSNSIIELMQLAADEIARKFDFRGTSFYTLVGNKCSLVAFTRSWYTAAVLKALPVHYSQLRLNLKQNSTNYLVRTILDGREMHSNSLADFGVPTISKKLASFLGKLVRFRSGISMPLNVKGEVIGAVLYHKGYEYTFKEELAILRALNSQIALTLARLQYLDKQDNND